MHRANGRFTFQGKGGFISGAISLLTSLNASGCRLSNLDTIDGGGLFVERGTVTFSVSGTEEEVKKFLTAYNN